VKRGGIEANPPGVASEDRFSVGVRWWAQATLLLHSRFEAISAPARNVASLAHTTSSVTHSQPTSRAGRSKVRLTKSTAKSTAALGRSRGSPQRRFGGVGTTLIVGARLKSTPKRSVVAAAHAAFIAMDGGFPTLAVCKCSPSKLKSQSNTIQF
jgi:hypothetical protein